jgi:hypothetical protein
LTAASRPRERGGFDSASEEKCEMSLNVSIPGLDQGQAPAVGAAGDPSPMESIRPDPQDPIPLRPSPQGVGTIMIRFVGLLFLAIAAMALVYLR